MLKLFCGCCIKEEEDEDIRGFSIDFAMDIRAEPLMDNYKKAVKDFEDLENTLCSAKFTQ